MKKPWHNRKNTKGGRHRKVRQQPKHRRDTVVFQEPAYTSSASGKYKSRFRPNGTPGTKPEAVILDMDGTLENWDGWPNPHAMEYAQKHHDEGRVLIIVTARDHEWSYKRTHDWLRNHLHLPFVGPICRPADDERYACDFKKHVYDQLSVVYDVVSAIDDDDYVLGMWRSIPGLEVVETNYDYQVAKSAPRSAVQKALGEMDYRSWSTCGDSLRDPEPTVYDDWDEYEWIKWEEEILASKRRQPKKRNWVEPDGGMDVFCHHCDHPWFDHDITGCTAAANCVCDG